MCCLCIVDMGKRSRAAAIALLIYDHRSYSIFTLQQIFGSLCPSDKPRA